MIEKIKIYAIGALVFVATFFYALFRMEQVKRAKEKLNAIKSARETEQKATGALVTGLKKESEIRNEKIDPDKRDHFTGQ